MKKLKNVLSFVSANLALAFCSGSAISSWLYYNNVSNDAMTPVVVGQWR